MASTTDLKRLWLYNVLGLDETSGAALSVDDLEHMYNQAPVSPGGGGGIQNVSGTVDLPNAPGIVEVYATAAASVEGVALAAGDAAVFRYFSDEWTFMIVGQHTAWQDVSGDTPPDPIEPTGPVSATALSVAHDATAAQNYTFPGMSLGAASTHRLVVACFRTHAASNRYPTVCTIGGVAATVVTNASGGTQCRSFAYAVIPSGTTGDVAVTFSGGCNNASVALIRVDNTVKIHFSMAGSANTKTLTVPTAPEALILAALTRASGDTVAWDSTDPAMTSLGTHSTDVGYPMSEAWGIANSSSEIVDATVDGLTPDMAAITFEKAV